MGRRDAFRRARRAPSPPDPNAPLPFDAEAFERRIAWIMGSPRTGSTWLLRLLIHPWRLARGGQGVISPPLARRRPDVVPIDESYLPQHLVGGLPRGPGATSVSLRDSMAGRPAYFFSDAFSDWWRTETRRLVLARFHVEAEAIAGEHGMHDPVVVIKEPVASHGAPFVLSLLPRSRLIFLVRDGRDVLDSLLDATAPGGWRTDQPGVRALHTPEQRLAFLKNQARAWVLRTEAVQRAYASHAPELRLELRYERLLAEPHRELARIDSWLGLGRDERQLRASVRANRFGAPMNRLRQVRRTVRAAQPGLWRENLTEEEQAAAHEIMGPKLAELGYPV